MPAAATKDIRIKLRLPMLPKDWMNPLDQLLDALARQIERQRRGKHDRHALVDLRPGQQAQHIAMRHLRQGQVGDHERDDADRHGQRQQRGNRFGDARPGERAHAAGNDDGRGARHDHRHHQALGLPEQPGGGIGGKARLGHQQQQDGHGQGRRRDDAHRAALEPAAEKGRKRVGAVFAHEGGKQHAHENETGVPADGEANRVEADDEERAGERQEAGAAERRHAEHQPIEESRHAAAAGEIVAGLARARARPIAAKRAMGPPNMMRRTRVSPKPSCSNISAISTSAAKAAVKMPK